MPLNRAVIVGGGIIGMLCALKLRERGMEVAVVEEHDFGGQATMASSGMLAPWTEVRSTVAFPFAEHSLASYASLSQQLLEETGRSPGYRAEGIFEVAETPEDAQRLQALAGEGGSQWLDPEMLRDAVPVAPHLGGALYWKREAQVHPPSLMRAVIQSATMNGISLRSGERVVELLQVGGRVVGVRSTAGPLEADVVVIAAGAWSRILAEATGLHVPVIPVRGQVLVMEDAYARLHHVLFSHRSGYLTPQADCTLIVGATEDECGYQDGVSAAGIAKVAQTILHLTPQLHDLRLLRGGSGLRPKAPDGQPVLGQFPGLEGLVFATGHFRNGILMAPATAEAVADLVVEGETRLPIKAFSPDRFL